MNKIRKFSEKEIKKAGIPRDIQWVITNKCELAFAGGHCSVPYGSKSIPELLDGGIGDVLQVIDILAILGLEIKILGGNLSDNRQAFLSVVDRMNQRGIKYAITDNGINKDTILEAIYNYGANGFVFSFDTLRSLSKYRGLPGHDLGGCSVRKSAAVLELIPEIRDSVNYLAVNTIIHAGNLEQIVPIVEYCTDELGKVIVNLCPLIHGSLPDEQGKNRYIFRGPTETVIPYVLQKKHKDRFIKLMDELIELKESGYAIGVPTEYLELLKENTCRRKFTWNCGKMEKCPILRLFPDGKFGVCSDLVGRDMQGAGLTPWDIILTKNKIRDRRRGKGRIHSYGFISEPTAEDLAENFAKINQEWLNDRDRNLCCRTNGCLWSNIVIAWLYQQKGYGTLTATAKNM